MEYCHECDKQIDTDFDAEHYKEHLCELCEENNIDESVSDSRCSGCYEEWGDNYPDRI